MTEPAVARPDNAALSNAPTATTPRAAERCPSCGGEIDARFCRVCGERRPSERAYSMREFAHEAFEAVTNVERSFLHTLWTLFRRPGELTAAYMRGERVRYLRPLQLFLLVNVLFFFSAGSVRVSLASLFRDRLHALISVGQRCGSGVCTHSPSAPAAIRRA